MNLPPPPLLRLPEDRLWQATNHSDVFRTDHRGRVLPANRQLTEVEFSICASKGIPGCIDGTAVVLKCFETSDIQLEHCVSCFRNGVAVFEKLKVLTGRIDGRQASGIADAGEVPQRAPPEGSGRGAMLFAGNEEKEAAGRALSEFG